MNKECQIKDDDEIELEEKNRFNFRRYTPDEIQKKHSPFERTKKREAPFLFQKKKPICKEDQKTSLEDILTKMESLTVKDLSGVQLGTPPFSPYSPKISTTPTFSPYSPINEIEEFQLESIKDEKNSMVEDDGS